MQVNLNTPPIIEGPLSAEQLDRKVNPGTIYRLHGEDGQVGCSFLMPAEAATEVGQDDEPDFGAFYGLKSAFIITGCVAVFAYGVHLLAGYFN